MIKIPERIYSVMLSIRVINKGFNSNLMKTYLTHRARTILAVAGIFLLLFSTCKKKDNRPSGPSVFKADVVLSGAKEVPAISTTGSGTAAITYNQGTRIITYIISWQLGSATATTTGMHFHGSETGSNSTNSPIVIGLTGFTSASSGTLSGTTRALTEVENNQLLAGKWYVNIHSSTVPTGEIRGNIVLLNTSNGGGNPAPGY